MTGAPPGEGPFAADVVAAVIRAAPAAARLYNCPSWTEPDAGEPDEGEPVGGAAGLEVSPLPLP